MKHYTKINLRLPKKQARRFARYQRKTAGGRHCGKPSFVKPNGDEIRALLGREISDEHSAAEAAKALCSPRHRNRCGFTGEKGCGCRLCGRGVLCNSTGSRSGKYRRLRRFHGSGVRSWLSARPPGSGMFAFSHSSFFLQCPLCGNRPLYPAEAENSFPKWKSDHWADHSFVIQNRRGSDFLS